MSMHIYRAHDPKEDLSIGRNIDQRVLVAYLGCTAKSIFKFRLWEHFAGTKAVRSTSNVDQQLLRQTTEAALGLGFAIEVSIENILSIQQTSLKILVLSFIWKTLYSIEVKYMYYINILLLDGNKCQSIFMDLKWNDQLWKCMFWVHCRYCQTPIHISINIHPCP